MATPLRFLRRRRRQPKGGGTSQTSFFRSPANESVHTGEQTPFFTPAFVQTKLTVNQPGDAHEQEADRMAEHVVQRKADKEEDKVQRQSEKEDEKPMQRKTDEEKIQRKGKHEEEPLQRMMNPDEEKVQKKGERDEEKPIQKKAIPGGASPAAPVPAGQLHGTKGQGSTLPSATLGEMSQAFGHDFGPVRIHNTTQAEQLSHDLQAQAFTHGTDIYFSAGKYNPETTEGKRLLAHELTHVVQQEGNGVGGIQRYAVPGALPCNEVVDWLNSNSPYAPEWAETRCTYAFNGQLTIRYQTLPNGSVKATVSGSPRLSVLATCPIDSPTWTPTARPNRATEAAAWQAMKSTLTAHERHHRRIGEEQRVAAQQNWRTVRLEVTGSDQADARQQVEQRVGELQQQWQSDAQTAQDAIDPFRGAVLDCP